MTEKTVRVRIKTPYRVVHEGNPFSNGDELTVSESTAAEWERSRWVERVTSKSSSPPARSNTGSHNQAFRGQLVRPEVGVHMGLRLVVVLRRAAREHDGPLPSIGPSGVGQAEKG